VEQVEQDVEQDEKKEKEGERILLEQVAQDFL